MCNANKRVITHEIEIIICRPHAASLAMRFCHAAAVLFPRENSRRMPAPMADYHRVAHLPPLAHLGVARRHRHRTARSACARAY